MVDMCHLLYIHLLRSPLCVETRLEVLLATNHLRTEAPLLAVLFFAESQFFRFHTEDQAAAVRENERCTRVLCDVMHAVVAVGDGGKTKRRKHE